MNWYEETVNAWAGAQRVWWEGWGSLVQTGTQFLDSPPLGFTREWETKGRQGIKAWQEYQEASLAYQVVIASGWTLVFAEWQEKLMALSQEGQTMTSLTEWSETWGQVADATFTDLFRSEDYVQAQGRLLNAAMACRLSQREWVEGASKWLDIPTRTEVDEAHRINYEQNKEIRALKQMLAEMQAQVAVWIKQTNQPAETTAKP